MIDCTQHIWGVVYTSRLSIGIPAGCVSNRFDNYYFESNIIPDTHYCSDAIFKSRHWNISSCSPGEAFSSGTILDTVYISLLQVKLCGQHTSLYGRTVTCHNCESASAQICTWWIQKPTGQWHMSHRSRDRHQQHHGTSRPSYNKRFRLWAGRLVTVLGTWQSASKPSEPRIYHCKLQISPSWWNNMPVQG
jgi:hypothetical protein